MARPMRFPFFTKIAAGLRERRLVRTGAYRPFAALGACVHYRFDRDESTLNPTPGHAQTPRPLSKSRPVRRTEVIEISRHDHRSLRGCGQKGIDEGSDDLRLCDALGLGL